jgi:Tfp pilus assembly protein PilV
MTMVEVLLSMIIIITSAFAVLMWQKTSWSQTRTTNRLMVAGHIIEKQIEQQRMIIAQDPATNFAAFKTNYVNKTVLVIDSTVRPYITVKWNVYDTLHDPQGYIIKNVYQAKLAASWGTGQTDTLKVTTCIAKNF